MDQGRQPVDGEFEKRPREWSKSFIDEYLYICGSELIHLAVRWPRSWRRASSRQ